MGNPTLLSAVAGGMVIIIMLILVVQYNPDRRFREAGAAVGGVELALVIEGPPSPAATDIHVMLSCLFVICSIISS